MNGSPTPFLSIFSIFLRESLQNKLTGMYVRPDGVVVRKFSARKFLRSRRLRFERFSSLLYYFLFFCRLCRILFYQTELDKAGADGAALAAKLFLELDGRLAGFEEFF